MAKKGKAPSNWSNTALIALLILGSTAAICTFGPAKVEHAREIHGVRRAVTSHRSQVRKGKLEEAWKQTAPSFRQQTTLKEFQHFVNELDLFYDSTGVLSAYESYDIQFDHAVYRLTVETYDTKAMFVVDLERSSEQQPWIVEGVIGRYLDLTVLQ